MENFSTDTTMGVIMNHLVGFIIRVLGGDPLSAGMFDLFFMLKNLMCLLHPCAAGWIIISIFPLTSF
jgi:hypothetical protein